MAEPFIGQVYLVGFNFAARGFALCEGQQLSIAQNTALFSLLGTTYGGNGTTVFALPDLRGRMPIGQGAGPGLTQRPIGQMAGHESTTLSAANLPSHSHAATLMAENGGAASNTPGGSLLAQADIYLAPGRAANVQLDASAVQVAPTGSNAPFDSMPPFLVMNYQIALVGIFPSRD
jgi:microcystin-dependent protein